MSPEMIFNEVVSERHPTLAERFCNGKTTEKAPHTPKNQVDKTIMVLSAIFI